MDHQQSVMFNYKQKNHSVVLSLIEQAPEKIRFSPHYKILKAACLVSLGRNIRTAHQIVDDINIEDPKNAFAFYVKGLAFLQQKKFDEAVENFDKAIELDKIGSMAKAVELRQEALDKKSLEADEKIVFDDSESDEGFQTKESEKASSGRESPVDDRTCQICSKTFTKPYSMKRHMLIHTGERPFKCSHCDTDFVRRFDLSRHLQRRHKGSELEPNDESTNKALNEEEHDECKINDSNQLNQHTIEAKELPFKCSSCPKAFKLNMLLMYHEKLHNNNRFTCDMCQFSTTYKINMKYHVKTHFDEKPFG
jgi:hypothetical protein